MDWISSAPTAASKDKTVLSGLDLLTPDIQARSQKQKRA